MNDTQEMKRWFTATMALQGMIASGRESGFDISVQLADELLELLERTKDKANEPT